MSDRAAHAPLVATRVLQLLVAAASAAVLTGPVVSASAGPASFAPLFARSVQGRRLEARHVGLMTGRVTLIFGAIHGDESAGVAIANDLVDDRSHLRANIWVVASLNPDGVAAHRRQNAHGVDLNRNFPGGWRQARRPGDARFGGPSVLSEPESRFAATVIDRLRPRITIWFHQPLGLVDLSGGSPAIERRFARLAQLPTRQLARYRGSASTWQNHHFPATTAFVVELPPGALGRRSVERYARAVAEIAQ